MTAADRKQILRKIPYGLYIMTALLDEKPVASVVSFVSQISIKPALIMTAVKVDSHLYAAVMQNRFFALHFCDRDNPQMIADFFKLKNSDSNHINGYKYTRSKSGTPLIDDSPMIIEARLNKVVTVGDHHPMIGEIVESYLHRDTDILAMEHTNWHYGG